MVSLAESEADARQPGDAGPSVRQPGRLTRKRVLVTLAALAVLAGAILGTLAATSGKSTAAALTVSSQKVTVSTGTMQQTVSASGTIAPGSEATLQFGVAGKVTAVDVTTGQKVTSGEVLAKVDATALQDTVNADEATLSSDEARLSTDKADSASTSQLDSDQAAVTQAQTQLSTAQTDLSDASLTSSLAGTVASVNLTVGQQVSGSGSSGTTGSSGSGTGASSSGSSSSGLGSSASSSSSSSSSSSGSSSADIVVIATGSYVVSTSVDDTEVGQIQVGDQATITPSGSTTVVYGTVSSVGLVASTSSSSVASFPVTIAVTGSPSGLYAGSSATVSIIVKQIDNAVEVPTSAISYSNGQATVTKVSGSSRSSQVVTTGISSGGYTQITSGLKAGDVVLERVVKFNGTSGSGRSILGGGSSTGNRIGRGFGGGGFGGGGFGGGAGFGGGGAGG